MFYLDKVYRHVCSDLTTHFQSRHIQSSLLVTASAYQTVHDELFLATYSAPLFSIVAQVLTIACDASTLRRVR